MFGIMRKTLNNWSSNSSYYKASTQLRFSTSSSENKKLSEDSSEEPSAPAGPPGLPSTCCMSGCANCVWLDYAEETVNYYKDMGEEMDFPSLVKEVEKNIDDPMIKAFITMELKSKYLFKKR